MTDRKTTLRKFEYLLLMSLFGCLGPVVKAIGFPTAVIAALRAIISGLALVIFLGVRYLIRRRHTNRTTDGDVLKTASFKASFKETYLPMLICGLLLAGDWIGLFASYNYTTIANATVVYYIVPMLVLIGSAVFLKERFTRKHGICAVIAFLGMVLVSGVISNTSFEASDLIGIAFSLLGAVSYAAVVLINKRFKKGDPIVRTTIQLCSTAIFTTPYVLLFEDTSAVAFTTKKVLLLLLLSVGMTAVTYIFYFTLILKIPSRTVAIFSYADPIVAVIISVWFMHEPTNLPTMLGAIMIVGAAIVSEW